MLAEFSGCVMAGAPGFLLGIKILKKDHIESYEIWKVMHLPTLSLENSILGSGSFSRDCS